MFRRLTSNDEWNDGMPGVQPAIEESKVSWAERIQEHRESKINASRPVISLFTLVSDGWQAREQ